MFKNNIFIGIIKNVNSKFNRTNIKLNRTKLRKIVEFRTPYDDSTVPFIVSWSHKSACTSILKWYLSLGNRLEDAIAYSKGNGVVIHRYENEIFNANPGYRDRLIDRIANGTPILNFMRCPYSRAFSSYMHIHNPKYEILEKKNVSNAGLNFRYRILRDLYGKSVPATYEFSFREYLEWIRDHNAEGIDPHHRPQYSSIYELPNVSHYKVEKLSLTLMQIEKKFNLGCKENISNLFKSEHHLDKIILDKRAALDFLNQKMPLDFTLRNKVPAICEGIIEGTIYANLIEKIFKKDISIYNSI